MKKFAISFIACLAFMQSTYAATSALSESLLEYQAITTAIGTNPSFQNVISANEFIVDIKRLTKQVNTLGEVMYLIATQDPSENDGGNQHAGNPHAHKPRPNNFYLAILSVVPPVGPGPNDINVVGIIKVSQSQAHVFFKNHFALEEESVL